MTSVAIAIMCKTPIAGQSKTRLSPPLRPEDCAAISACFIRDVSATIQSVANESGAVGYALYAPAGTERELRALLPDAFRLSLQSDGDLGVRVMNGTRQLLAAGHAGAILVNADSPTLPPAILRAAVDAVRAGDNVVLSPALDGGYTLIGVSRLHQRLYEDIPWSTAEVYSLTLQRAREIALPVVNVPGWYDVDDARSFAVLEEELGGKRPDIAAPGLVAAGAAATRQFMQAWKAAAAVQR